MIGIRAEDKNPWERRAPLTPEHVAELTGRHGIEIGVAPSDLRAFPMDAYVRAGAREVETLESCDVILGVKEIPVERLVAGRPHAFFAHVIKGQVSNMPLLRRILELGCTLIDYERIVDADDARLVFFGRHAGYAGMIDALWILGRRLASEGIDTPFSELRQALTYPDLDTALHHVAAVGDAIRRDGVPDAVEPLVFGFTGSGNVTTGALEVFDRLPFHPVAPDALDGLPADADRPRNAVHRVVFGRAERYRKIDGGPFDAAELEAHPERFASGLEDRLPRLTALIHGAYWALGQPKLVTLDALARLSLEPGVSALRLIADLTCDVGGGIESTVEATTPGDPVYTIDAATGTAQRGIEGPAPVVLAVDNLPCELPIESSQHFGDALLPFVPVLDRCDWSRPIDELELPNALRRAVIAHGGRLAPDYAYLRDHLRPDDIARGPR